MKLATHVSFIYLKSWLVLIIIIQVDVQVIWTGKLCVLMLRLAVDRNVSVEPFVAVSLRAPFYSDVWTLGSEGAVFVPNVQNHFPMTRHHVL